MKAATGGGAQASPLERAGDFLRRHGDALAAVRAEVLLGRRDPADLERPLGSRRCAAGGFGEDVGDSMPTLLGALRVLEILDEAGIRRGPLAEEAATWLGRAQREDGAWRASEADDGVEMTGRIAGLLARLRCGSPRTLARAEAFLDESFAPERVETGGIGPVLAFALPASSGLMERADEALQWCGRALEKGTLSGEIEASEALEALVRCDAEALPGARLEAGPLLLAFLARQAVDGGFGAVAGPTPERVEATLLAVRALRRFGGRLAAPGFAKG